MSFNFQKIENLNKFEQLRERYCWTKETPLEQLTYLYRSFHGSLSAFFNRTVSYFEMKERTRFLNQQIIQIIEILKNEEDLKTIK